jgi:YD repeat-containing protein
VISPFSRAVSYSQPLVIRNCKSTRNDLRFLLAALFITACFLTNSLQAFGQSWSNGYSYRRQIVIDHTRITNFDQSNFPVLIAGTYGYLATSGNGGHVANPNGYDIIFTSDATGSAVLPFEQESFSASSGQINYWVKVPTLSHSADTVIYLFYGNSSISSDQSNKTAVWDSNFRVVEHLSETSGTTIYDSTANGLNGTKTSATNPNPLATGWIGGAQSFTSTSSGSITIPDSISPTAYTISAWLNPAGTAASENIFVATNSSGPASSWTNQLRINNAGKFEAYNYDGGHCANLGHGCGATGITTISPGTWYYVVITATNGGIESLYVNGVLEATSPTLGTMWNGVTQWRMGSNSGDSMGYFNGIVDELEYSNSLRSADWISTQYNNQHSPATFYSLGDESAQGSATPSVTVLSPSSEGIGTSITITGTNFGATQGTSTALFNGTSATPANWNATSIVVPVPVGATSGNVVVTVGGVSSNGVPFQVTTPPPNISSLFPTSGPFGTSVTISGKDFGATQGGSAVSFNGAAATPTSWSPTSIVVPVPNTATTGNVVVTVGSQSSNGSSFTVTTPVPNIGGLYPTSGPIGASVTISGANFGTSQGTSTVTFNGTSATSTNWNASAITVPVPAGATTGNVVVTVGGQHSNFINFIVSNGGTAVSYTYDDVGRLTGVTDSSGNAANYSYDSVGNILAISRSTPGQVSVVGFTPDSGPVGTSVTISGTGFSSTSSQNSVQFGSTSASIVTTSTTQIVATVPSGASTGHIGVTSPNGSASSSASFTVTAGTGVPTITGFSPSVAIAGTAISINGTNFDPLPRNNRLQFNSTPQTVNSVTGAATAATTVPSGTGSGRITIATAQGTAVSTQDLFIPFLTHAVGDVGYTSRTSVGGNATVVLGTAHKIGLVIFDGSRGERIGIQTSSGTFSTCTIYLFDPHGTQIFSGSCVGSNNLLTIPVLSMNGTYAIGIDPGASTGSVSVAINDVSDVTGTITPGGPPVVVTTTKIGQDARITFGAKPGQKVTLKITGVTNPSATVALLRPDGSTQTSTNITSGSNTFLIDDQSVQISGPYTFFIQHSGNNFGSETLQLYDSTDITGSIAIDGSAVTVGPTAIGQDVRLTFSASAGQRIVAYVTNVTNPSAGFNLLRPDGSQQRYMGLGNNPAGQTFFMDTQTLATTGTYTLWINHSGTNVGSETVQLKSVTADITGPITIDGSAVTVGPTAVGQDVFLTFTATAGQRVVAYVTNVSNPSAGFLLVRPDGSQQYYMGLGNNPAGQTFYMNTQTLATAGTYKLWINHSGTNVGSETVQLKSVPADITGPITIDGSAVTVGPTAVGQDVFLTFTATAGQRVVAYVTNVSNPSAGFLLVRPDGSQQYYMGLGNNPAGQTFYMDTQTLATAGTYKLWINHSGTNVGSETLQLNSVPSDVTGSTSINGSTIRIPTTGNLAAGQNAYVTFAGTASQTVTVHLTNNTLNLSVNLLKPDGSGLTGVGTNSSSFNLSTVTLPSTGTYTIKFDPSSYSTGTISVNVTSP